jgi:hypothetical protein
LAFDWIFKATELGKKYYKAVKCEHDRIINEVVRIKRMRNTEEKRGQKDEKPSLIELLIQYGDISKEEIVGEIFIIGGVKQTLHLMLVAMFWPCLGKTTTSRKG